MSLSPSRARLFQAAFAITISLLGTGVAHAQSIPVPQNPTVSNQGISVVGTGIVLAEPDVARVSLGVDVINQSLTTAQSQAAQQMDAVIQKVQADGIPDADVHTTGYSISPRYDYQNGQSPVLRGYEVQNQVDVRSTNVAQLGTLIDDAVGDGATRVNSIMFESSDPSALKQKARDAAMQNATSAATQLAGDAGVSLGRAILVSESDTNAVTPQQAQPAPAAAPAAASDARAATTPIQPGQLQVTATVQVVWAIQ